MDLRDQVKVEVKAPAWLPSRPVLVRFAANSIGRRIVGTTPLIRVEAKAEETRAVKALRHRLHSHTGNNDLRVRVKVSKIHVSALNVNNPATLVKIAPIRNIPRIL